MSESYWQTREGRIEEAIRRGLREAGVNGPLADLVGPILPFATSCMTAREARAPQGKRAAMVIQESERGSWRCRLGLHTLDRSQGLVGYCLRPGCDDLKPICQGRYIWIRYVEPPSRRKDASRSLPRGSNSP